jgi:hypothetical protein
MKFRVYSPTRIPFILDVASYQDHWKRWWTACQPAWRQNDGWPLMRDTPSVADWHKVCARGQSGLFLVIISTAWWASSIQSEEEWVRFDNAMDDLLWVIEQVRAWLKALPVPTPPAPSNPPQKPVSSSDVSWFSRADGKRQPKPSRRLMEAGL